MKNLTFMLLAFLLSITFNSLTAQEHYGCKTIENEQTNHSKSFVCNLTSGIISQCYNANYNLAFHFVGNNNGENFTCDPDHPILNINPMLYTPKLLNAVVGEMNKRMGLAVLGIPNPSAKISFSYLNENACGSSFFYRSGDSPQFVSEALNIVFVNDPSNPGVRAWTYYGSNRIYVENVLASFLAGSNNFWDLGRLINHEFGHTRGLKHTFNCNNPCDGIDIVVEDECNGTCWSTDSYSSGCWGSSKRNLMMAYGTQLHFTECEFVELWCYITNNPAPYQIVTNICTSGSDLVVSSASVSSSSVSCGGTITGNATVENIGNTSANSFSYLGYYLSTNTIWDATDTYLELDYVSSLATGSVENVSASLSIPTNLAPGTYYILFVADYTFKVLETNESNNVTYQAITVSCSGPDLTNYTTSISSPWTSCGGTITGYATVKNIGGTSTNGNSFLGYYLSANTTFDASDTYLAHDNVGIIAPSASSNQFATLTIPAHIPSGDYYILFVADLTDKISETNENNNVAYQEITVSCGDSDLIVPYSFVSTNTVVCGEDLSVGATIENIGITSTGSYTYLGYYLSANTILDAGDILLEYDYVATLPAGSSGYETATLTIPNGLATGTYYILFKADYLDWVDESDENNNVDYQPIYICCSTGSCTDFTISNTGTTDYSTTIVSGVSATVDFALNAYSIPDQLIVSVNGIEMINVTPGSHPCVGNPSTMGGTINIEPCDEVEIEVIGNVCPAGNTLWNLQSVCNGNLLPPNPLEDAKMSALEMTMAEAPKQSTSNNKTSTGNSSTLRNYPNPFKGQTTIEFDLLEDTAVTLYVSDITGKKIEVLLNDEHKFSGIHQVTFDGRLHPAGVYYYTILAGENLTTKKMILIE